MADYKSCAWYQNGTCIRDDKSGAPISCADYEDYERRVVFKIEDFPERNEEMSVRKQCYNCKHYQEGFCNCAENGGVCLTTELERWELSDDAKADVLHYTESGHDIPKYKSCKRYINGSCANAKIFADKPGTIFDCSKCKSYILGYHKLPTNTPTNTPTETEHDAVEHPSHYTSGGIECIDCIKAALGENFMGFLMGNVIKYSYRYKHKNGVEDLKKARWYLDRAIKELTDEER